MQVTECCLKDVREGVVFLHAGQTLTVKRVYFRKGRGLELHTRGADGYLGPVIWPDEPLSAVFVPSTSEDDVRHAERTTLDYPWATVA